MQISNLKQLSIAFTVFCGFLVRQTSLSLKFVTILVNGLVLFLNLNVLFLYWKIHGNIDFSITREGWGLISSGITFSIFNSYMLAKTNHKDIRKIISQNLILSATFVTILLGSINGLDQILIFKISPLTILSIAFLSIVTLYNHINHCWNKFDNSLKHTQFISIFILNIAIFSYNVYFDFTQIKTFGLSIWLILFLGSTFWQLNSLDNSDEAPFIGSLLNNASSSCRNLYNSYFENY